MKNVSIFSLLWALSGIVVGSPAWAQTDGSAVASSGATLLSRGVSMLVACPVSGKCGRASEGAGLGSILLVQGSTLMVVESIEKTAQGVAFVVRGVAKGASQASRLLVKLGGEASGAASVAVGQSVHFVTDSVGTAVLASGKVIAFIPNEVGQALIHHSHVNESH